MNADQINKIIGIRESFKLPEKMMAILSDEDQKNRMFDRFMAIGESLDHDWFTEYFEEEHSNKSKMAQDFTPQSVTKMIGDMAGSFDSCSDVAAGTGGITIGLWQKNKDARYNCYEISERAIPLLIFNLAIRNMNASVTRIDILTGEIFEHYEIAPGKKYSSVIRKDFEEFELTDLCVSNPPYSLKYNPKNDTRFPEFEGMLPTNFADYVFVAFGLHLSKDAVHLIYVLPHGVLFRRSKEEKFRKWLISKNLVKTVIGLPDNLFINTGIPVMILEIAKSKDVLFVDAKDEFEKGKHINVMTDKNIENVEAAIRLRKGIERFSHVAELKEIEENGYNLNIPRYVDTTVEEVLPGLDEVLINIARDYLDEEDLIMQVLNMFDKLCGTTEEDDRMLKDAVEKYKTYIIDRRKARDENI